MVHKGHVKISKISELFGHLLCTEPQCFKSEKYIPDEKSDIYAVGLLLWELTSGKRPFKDLTDLEIVLAIQNGRREQPVNGTPQVYVNLYQECWDQDPGKRPTLDDIIATLSAISEISNEQYLIAISANYKGKSL